MKPHPIKKKPEHINKKEILTKILPVIKNTLLRFDLIPLEVDFTRENHRWFLRVFIYSFKHPVSHKDCEDVTRSMSDFLDELIPVKYYLEVSSPGLDRKFKSDAEYLIFKNKLITLKLKEPQEFAPDKKIKAKILDFTDLEGLRIFLPEQGQEVTIPKDNILSARLYIDPIEDFGKHQD